ncbi:hypothetical protein GCM10023074_56710 [Microbispora amethystogenes]|uniref:Uncharacterized protein n=1 Tax=Microbispora amethystogenes TaxID=1427754 RepID=A0ABQ4FHY3_9ACTN|nr:hypothetical protein Mam01_45510 [Microbispora amethystogenes]
MGAPIDDAGAHGGGRTGGAECREIGSGTAGRSYISVPTPAAAGVGTTDFRTVSAVSAP